jgi:hypothetical protein
VSGSEDKTSDPFEDEESKTDLPSGDSDVDLKDWFTQEEISLPPPPDKQTEVQVEEVQPIKGVTDESPMKGEPEAPPPAPEETIPPPSEEIIATKEEAKPEPIPVTPEDVATTEDEAKPNMMEAKDEEKSKEKESLPIPLPSPFGIETTSKASSEESDRREGLRESTADSKQQPSPPNEETSRWITRKDTDTIRPIPPPPPPDDAIDIEDSKEIYDEPDSAPLPPPPPPEDYVAADHPSFSSLRDSKRIEDEWLLTKVEELKKTVEDAVENEDTEKLCLALEDFIINDVSSWYLEKTGEKNKDASGSPDNESVLTTLNEVLTDITRLLDVLSLDITDEMEREMDASLSGILLIPPEHGGGQADTDFVEQIIIARDIILGVLSARHKAGLNPNWPLKQVVIMADSVDVEDAVEALRNTILRQTNTLDMEIVPPGEEWDGMDLEVVPNMELISPVFRQWASKIVALLHTKQPSKIKAEIEKGEYSLGLDGQQVAIKPDMVSFTEKLPENVFPEEFSGGILYIDTELTHEVRSKGFTSEVTSRIIEMREELGVEAGDYVNTQISGSDELYMLLEDSMESIAGQTRSQTLSFIYEEPQDGYIVKWNVEGEEFTISIIPEDADLDAGMDQ